MPISIYQMPELPSDRKEQLRENWAHWKKANNDNSAIFFPVFKDFLPYLKKLKPGPCKLYLYLGLQTNKSGESWYSVERMAEDLDVATRTIDDHLKQLEDIGLITRGRSPNTSSRTYMLPYSFNMYMVKPTTEQTMSSMLTKALREAYLKQEAVGSVYRIIHLFQWPNDDKPGCNQAIAVITKKTSPKGPEQYTAFIGILQIATPELVIDSPLVNGVCRFTSNLQASNHRVIGIAVENDEPILEKKYQQKALSQVYMAPDEHFEALPQVRFIPPAPPVQIPT